MEVPLANVVAPRLEGDEYQSLFFWYHAASLLSKDTIKEIHYESDDVDGVDDLIIYYNSLGVDAGGWNSMADYFQIKYHVDNRNRYGSEAIIDPQFINCKKSLLQRFYDAHESIKIKGIEQFRLLLASNWHWDQNDPLFCQIRDSDGSLPKSYFEERKSQRVGKIRESWRKHLNIDEQSFVSFAEKLRFQMNHFGRRNFKEHVMDRLCIAGLVVPNDSNKAELYTGLALKFIKDGIKSFTRESLLAICRDYELIAHRHTAIAKDPVIGIRSFIRFAERIEDECDSHLCISEKFEGRVLKDGLDWSKDVAREVSDYLSRPDFLRSVRAVEHCIMLECHGSIALLSGYLLPRISGARIYPVQKGIESTKWKPVGKTNIDWGWDIRRSELIPAAEAIILSLSLTHDINTDVEKYLQDNEITARCMVKFCSSSGFSLNSIDNGDHAIYLVNGLIKEIGRIRQDNPNSELHLFFSAPNGFMFLLGQTRNALGSIQLYEYDYTNESNGSYSPSSKLPLGI